MSGWGYGRTNDNGLAPVHEGPHHSPVIGNAAASSESGSFEEDGAQQSQLQASGRPAMIGGGLSPGLGLDLANQALNGVTQGRPEQDNGDGIVVSFAGMTCSPFAVAGTFHTVLYYVLLRLLTLFV